MSDTSRTSREIIEQKLRERTAVMDVHGETIGVATAYDMLSGNMTVSSDILPLNTQLPLDTIGDTSASGLYLTSSRDELMQQYGTGDTSGGVVQDTTATMAPAAVATGMAAGTMDTSAVRTGTVNRMAPDVTTAAATQDVTTTGAEGDIRVPVMEEELVVGTRQEELGHVHVHKEVVTEQQSVPVTLQREQVIVERVPVTDASADTSAAFMGTDIEVPVMGEEAVMSKQARVVEEVRLRKDTVTETEQVSDSVRKERVTVEAEDEQTQPRGQTRLSGSDSGIDGQGQTP